jgi:hypothetical protein
VRGAVQEAVNVLRQRSGQILEDALGSRSASVDIVLLYRWQASATHLVGRLAYGSVLGGSFK